MNSHPARGSRSDWQLPPGVTQGGWQYSQAPFIAEDYDAYLAEHGLLRLDQQIIEKHLRIPGTVVDLGCGTGRALLPLVRQGFHGIGVDLSQSMLEVLQRKAAAENLPIDCVRGNLVELGFLADQVADYVLCLFSTLGMITGHPHRRAVLAHVCRILKPGGLFVLHVHNYWHSLWLAGGRRWIAGNLLRSLLGREPRGDKQYDYRGIRNFYLHVFTRRELRRLIRGAGLEPIEWNLVGPRGDRPLKNPWLIGNWRAQGWIIVCRAPTGRRES
jgi:SAM-dependent methyltransferase